MGKSFDLTARLKLAGPYNVKPIVSALKRELKTVKGSIDIKISPAASRNANVLNKALDTLQKNISRVSSNAMNATYSIDQLAKSFSQFGSNAKVNNAALNTTVKNMNKVKASASSATSEIESFGKSAGLAVKRFAAFTIATGAIFGFVAAVAKATKEAIDFQDELVKISQVTGNTVKGVRSLGDEVSNLSVKYGVSSKELLNAAKTLAQAGFSARETKKALDSLAKSTLAPSFDDLGNTTEGLISIFGQFRSELHGTKLAVEDFDSILGSINQVSKDFAVEADDIVTAIRGAGSVFAQASEGLDKPKESLNKLIALFTSVRATTRESAESISTGLRTIFARIQRRSTIDFLKQFGVQLEDLEGKFVGPFEAVKRLNEGLKDLDPRDVRYSQIAEELGGIRQLSKLLPLIRQFPVALEAFDAAQRGTNSTTEDAVKAQESLIVQFRKVREEFLRLVKDVLHTDSFSSLAKTALDFASTLIKIASAVKNVAPYLALALGVGAVKGGAQFLTGFKQAFTGGGKTLAGGVGQAAGTVLSGGAGSKNAQSLDDNTAALKALTVALVGSRSAGGPYPKGLHFAKGGVVPGSGNRDTVPAMLTPGEMVIPRKYVKGSPGGVNGLSPEELARIKAIKAGTFTGSKKSSSGNDLIAGTNSISNPAVAGLFLQPQGSDLRTVRNGGVGSLPQNAKAAASAAGAGPNNKIYYPFHAAFIEPSQAGKMKKDMDTLIKSSVRTIANKYGGGSKINLQDRDNIIKNSNLSGAGGSVFEAFVQSLSSEFKKNDSGATWDLTPGAFGAGLKNLFGPIPSSIKHLDVKLTANEGAYGSLKEKTNAQIGQAGFSFHAYGGEHGKSYDEISRNNISTSFGNRTIKKFASGGAAMGTDTVPAMLTPGEFVINKKSAQSIGYGNLDKINKYASGGTVKENPLFNNKSFSSLSTNPTLAGKSGIQKLNFLDKFQRAFDGLSPTAQQLQNALKRYITLVNQGVASEDALVRVQTALTKVQAKQAQVYSGQTSGGTAASGRTIRTRGFGQTGIGSYIAKQFPTFIGKRLTSEEREKREAKNILRSERNARISQSLFYGGVALGTAGAAITANSTNATTSGIGGAATGAGAGIAAGSQLGPIGAIAGGLIGGLTGFRDGIDEFNRSKALKNTELSLSKLDDAIQQVTENMSPKNIEDFNKAIRGVSQSKAEEYQAASNASSFSVSNALATGAGFGGEGSRRARAGTGGFIPYLFSSAEQAEKGKVSSVKTDINEIFADMEVQAKQAEELIKAAAAKGDFAAAERIATANTGVLNSRNAGFRESILNRAGALTGETKAGIGAFIGSKAQTFRGVGVGGSAKSDSLITLAKEAAKISDSLSSAITEVDLVIISLNKFNAELDRGTNLFDKFSQANDTLISQIQGNFAITKTNRENPFSNIDSYSANEVKSASRGLGSESLATGVNAAKTLKDALPEFLGKLTAGGEENIRAGFSNFLATNGTNLPTEVKNLLEASFNAESAKRSGGEAKFEDIKKPEFANKLLKDSGLETYVDSAKKVFDKRIELEHRYIDEISKTIQLREIVEQKATDIDKVQADITKRRADREGRELSFGEATTGVKAKFSRLTTTPGFLGRPTTRNVSAATLGGEITAAQAAQQAITNKGNRGGLSPAEIAEQARLGKLIKDNTEALNILKDSNEVLAAIENERSKIEKKKDAGRGLADKLFGGGVRGRVELNRQIGAAQAFLSGDKSGLTAGGGKGYEDIKAGIATLVEIAKFQGDNKAAKEIGDKFDEMLGIRKPADEVALARAEDEAGKVQLEAANALKTVAEVGLPTMIGNANNAFLQLQNFLSVAIAKFEGGVVKRAGGGYISGPGGPRGDKIPAMLSDGEYVINASAAARLGPDRLNALNSVHAASGGGARALARRQGISLASARSQLRYQNVANQYKKTLNYVSRYRATSSALADGILGYATPANPNPQPGTVFNYERYDNKSTLGRLGNVQRYGRNYDKFRRNGYKFANGGPVNAGGNIASGISSAMGQFQSSVLVLSQAVNQLSQINIPSNITMTGTHTVEVVINGATVLNDLLNGPLAGLIKSEIQVAIQKHIPLQQRMEGTY